MIRGRWPSRFVLSILGIIVMSIGLYKINPTQAAAASESMFAWSAKLSTTAQGSIFAGNNNFSNLTPGDTFNGQLIIKNNNHKALWVQIINLLHGGENGHPDLFANYPHSMDASFGEPTDNHPATVSYSISLSGILGTASPIQVNPFHTSELSTPFLLQAKQTATVDYVMQFPITAHNDYQGATGTLKVKVVYSPEVDDNGPIQGGTLPATGF